LSDLLASAATLSSTATASTGGGGKLKSG